MESELFSEMSAPGPASTLYAHAQSTATPTLISHESIA